MDWYSCVLDHFWLISIIEAKLYCALPPRVLVSLVWGRRASFLRRFTKRSLAVDIVSYTSSQKLKLSFIVHCHHTRVSFVWDPRTSCHHTLITHTLAVAILDPLCVLFSQGYVSAANFVQVPAKRCCAWTCSRLMLCSLAIFHRAVTQILCTLTFPV